MKNKSAVITAMILAVIFAVTVSAAVSGDNFEYVESKIFDITDMFGDDNIILESGDIIVRGYLAEFKNVASFYKRHGLFAVTYDDKTQAVYTEDGKLLLGDIPDGSEVFISENVFVVLNNPKNKSSDELSGDFYIYSNNDGYCRAELSYDDYRSSVYEASPTFYFTNGYYAFRNKGGLTGVLDEYGEIAVTPAYTELSIITGESWRDKFIARFNGLYGVISADGTNLTDFKYSAIHQYGFYTQDDKYKYDNMDVHLFAERMGMMVLLDTDLKEVTEPVEVQLVRFIGEDLFTLKYLFNGSRQTLITSTGSDIPFMVGGYSDIGSVRCGIAYVSTNNLSRTFYGFLNTENGEVTELCYTSITGYGFSEDMCGVTYDVNGRIYGAYLDTDFNTVIELPYGYVPYSGFSGGIAAIKKSSSSEISFIDVNGEIVIDGSGIGWREASETSEGYIWMTDSKGKSVLIRYKGDIPSSWADDEISEAIEKGLVPEDMQCFYKSCITRAEFARLAVILCAKYEGISETQLVLRNSNSGIFSDTDDAYVTCAASMGIIAGRGNGIFDPDSAITREEAAKMLYFTYIASKSDSPERYGELTYADKDKISSWAVEPVEFLTSSKVMNGVGDNKFDPSGLYTREQAYLTFLRLFDYIS